MLSFVLCPASIAVQGPRRDPMQLELLPLLPQAPEKPRLWERLSPEHRAMLIAVLARLMRKAVHGEPRRDTDER
jgi:hypothetical protein